MAATPAARWGKPAEIGALARYICTDATSFMTGTDILMTVGGSRSNVKEVNALTAEDAEDAEEKQSEPKKIGIKSRGE